MDIQEIIFPKRQYLTLKKSIPISEIANKEMYDQAGKKLGQYMGQHGITPTGNWSVLYFSWDQANHKTEIGIAFPVENLSKAEDPDLSIVEVPGGSAALGVLPGSYQGLSETHMAMNKYLSEHSYKQGNFPLMSIEEYQTGPMENPNPENWRTNIYYFYQN